MADDGHDGSADGRMKGGIRQHGSGWQAKVYAGRGADGRKQYVARTFRTRREAEHWRVAKLKEYHETGEVFEPTKLTVAEYLEQWLADLRGAGKSPSTLSDYGVAVRKHIIPAVGALPLPRLTPARVQAFYRGAREEKTSRVMRSIHYTLSASLTRAMKQGLIRDNPCTKLDAPKHTPKEAEALSPEQVARFLEAAQSDRLYPLWLLACTTALRRGELCGLRWQDVSLDAARLTVRQQLIVVGGHNLFKPPKTVSSKAGVPLLPEAVQALRDWQTVQNVEKATTGPLWEEHGGGLVFCQANGRPLHPNNLLKRDFRRLLAKARLDEKLRIHDLRHTVATVLIGAGVDPKTAQALLRHSRIATTLDIYTHLTPGLSEQAIQHLRSLIPHDE